MGWPEGWLWSTREEERMINKDSGEPPELVIVLNIYPLMLKSSSDEEVNPATLLFRAQYKGGWAWEILHTPAQGVMPPPSSLQVKQISKSLGKTISFQWPYSRHTSILIIQTMSSETGGMSKKHRTIKQEDKERQRGSAERISAEKCKGGGGWKRRREHLTLFDVVVTGSKRTGGVICKVQ